MTENLRKARATDFYVLRNDAKGESFEPRFTYHCFQYVEVTGYPGHPDMNALTGIVLQSDTPMTSGFECGDPVANQLFKNIVWTQRARHHYSVPGEYFFFGLEGDWPHRHECIRVNYSRDADNVREVYRLIAEEAARTAN